MKPILFNSDMVRAILDGRKTVTRRVIKGQDKNTMYAGSCLLGAGLFDNKTKERVIEPLYKVGDVLYVRETVWQKMRHYLDVDCETKYVYCNDFLYVATDRQPKISWNYSWVKRPSIHMPKEAARLFLRVTSVRVERLQDITLKECHKEGINISTDSIIDGENITRHHDFSLERFEALWDSTIKKDQLNTYGWGANPYVCVIEFEVITADQAQGN